MSQRAATAISPEEFLHPTLPHSTLAAGELLEMLESLPRGAVEASVRLMRGYNRTGEWPEPILTSPAPQRGRSPSPVDEWSDG